MAMVRRTYIPATSIRRINTYRARRGVGPMTQQSMAEFMVSPRIQAVALEAARDIAAAAVGIATAEITRDTTHAYVDSIHAEAIAPVFINGNPRAAATVIANGGTESRGGFKDPESSHAAVVEFGNLSAPWSGRRIFGRVGAVWHSPKAVGR